MKPLRFLSLIALLLPGLFLAFTMTFPVQERLPMMAVAFADDEDEEDEEEDEDENEDEDSEPETKISTPKTKTIKVIKEVVEYKPVTQIVIVTEAAYASDTDNDGLVDALDPDPSVSQVEYFTDSDNDGVPNALDLYVNEDDFAYYEFETDNDNNGILDSYENI